MTENPEMMFSDAFIPAVFFECYGSTASEQ